MCIIVFKPMGVTMPTKNTLRTCFERNPHGAGMMVARNGAVHISKGFMTYKEFAKELATMHVKTAEAAVFHFRIRTAGPIAPHNCHPFPVTGRAKDLKASRINAKLGMAHNGTVAIAPKGDMSDTMVFVKDILSKESVLYNRHDSAIRKMLEKYLTWSKVILLKPNGKAEFLGAKLNVWRQLRGSFYSNDTYKTDRTQQLVEEHFSKIKDTSPVLDIGARYYRNTFSSDAISEDEGREDLMELDFGDTGYDKTPRSICSHCGRATARHVEDNTYDCDWCGYVNID